MLYWSLLTLFVAAGIGTGNEARVIEEPVDLIELNHFHDPCGRHVYDQVIFYNVAPETGKFHVRAWCLVEDRETLSRRPLMDPKTAIVRVEWWDDQQQIMRRLSSKQYRESWTQVDPERSDRACWDERLRLSLVQCPRRAEAERLLRHRELTAMQTDANSPADASSEDATSSRPRLILAGSSRR